MAEGGMESEDYLKYIAEDSGNVAADGNFSVQVRLHGAHQQCHLCSQSLVLYPGLLLKRYSANSLTEHLEARMQL